MAKSKTQKKDASLENGQVDPNEAENQQLASPGVEDGDEKLPPFLRKQKSKLHKHRDILQHSIKVVSRENLR
jgi:hypothetical protein